MKNMVKILLICLAMPLFSGCFLLRLFGFPVGDKVPYNPKATSGDVAVKRNAQFPDIPVPLGFNHRQDKIFSFQGEGFRIGNFIYEGVWSFRLTKEFYRQQMPESGWKLIEIAEGDNAETQIYGKGRERCRVIIESKIDYIEVQVRVYNERRVKASPQLTKLR